MATALKQRDEAVHKHIGSVDDLPRSGSGRIREHENRPAPKQVEEDAADIVNQQGQRIPEESYLAESRSDDLTHSP
ncbi:MAG: hypothetical protein V5A38_13650 [Halolamina sp.]|uniref:hypothetical protein n=1 Tax=Halolamina sp. TaxID=1940283 RepID=UPI002FC2F5A1